MGDFFLEVFHVPPLVSVLVKEICNLCDSSDILMYYELIYGYGNFYST